MKKHILCRGWFLSTQLKVVMFSIAASLLCCVSCSDDEDYEAEKCPIETIPVLELYTETPLGMVSTCNNTLLSAGTNTIFLTSWSDLKGSLKRFPIEESWLSAMLSGVDFTSMNTNYALLQDNQLVFPVQSKLDTRIVVKDINTDSEIHNWSLTSRWQCDQIKGTVKGIFTVLLVSEDTNISLKEGRFFGFWRLGIIKAGASEIEWVNKIERPKKNNGLPRIYAVSVSENGRYLAAVGISNGGFIHITDVEQKKTLWEKVPEGNEVPIGKWTVAFNEACFSPDGKYVYVAGNCGLFCFDVASGKILSQWLVNDRCMSVAVSPDGHLVAGGILANGDVLIWDSNTGKRLLKLQTGQYTPGGLAFSPDSKFLATEGVKNTNVKIWKMPEATNDTIR